ENVISVTVKTQFQKSSEIEFAKKFTDELKVKSFIIEIDILKDEIITKNPIDRCYYCKQKIFSEILNFAKNMGFENVIEGSNLSDLEDYRPGMKALKELKIKSPLLELGFTKEEIRALSKELNLPTFDKMPESCLATRIPYGNKIEKIALERIEEGEEFIKNLGFKLVRLRDANGVAKIEVLNEEIEKLIFYREKIIEKLKNLGYNSVLIDLEGYKIMKKEEKFKWI
ncbi:MAG: ATP-dependent sacrificial sulfur transferase LarE, partial [Caldisericia bacterium]|nr:ATP-dependent sacrificial sulfur transferase LarE [Caldisericia bacterium]